jgi:hypothetical protein
MSEEDFIRERKLPFWRVVVLILSGWKKSLQNRVNKFFEELDKLEEIVTGSAFSQARKKVKWEIFKELNHKTVEYFYNNYDKEGLVRRWNDHLLLAVDCSKLNLHDTKEAREKYTIQTNQHDEKGVCQGLSSFLYDVLNEVTINSTIDKVKGEKLFIFEEHKNYYKDNAIILYDCGYAAYSVIAYHIKEGINFIIRCPINNTFKDVEKFIKSKETDKIVKIKVTEKQRYIVEKLDLPFEVSIRVVKVLLDSGETEILLTGLINNKRYKTDDFKEVYNHRWGIETYFDRIKNQLDIERFSSGKINSLLQDFYGIVFLSTLESVLSKEEEQECSNICQEKGRKYEYRLNKSVSYSAILDNVVDIFLDSKISETDVMDKLRKIFKTGLTPIRLERKINRKRTSDCRKLRFHKYEKKIIT